MSREWEAAHNKGVCPMDSSRLPRKAAVIAMYAGHVLLAQLKKGDNPNVWRIPMRSTKIDRGCRSSARALFTSCTGIRVPADRCNLLKRLAIKSLDMWVFTIDLTQAEFSSIISDPENLARYTRARMVALNDLQKTSLDEVTIALIKALK